MDKKTITAFVIIFLVGFQTIGIQSNMQVRGEKIEGNINLHYRSLSIYVPAVAETDQGYIGIPTSLTVTMHNGTGKIFVDTLPLTQIDMQGSARLAVNVASSISGIDSSNYDFFFVMRTNSTVIGGPSASAVMTIASIALLENWDIYSDVMMTGMINPDGTIGPVGGIISKLEAANQVKATRFLIPEGQGNYTEMETVRQEFEGGVQIFQKPVYYDVSKYAKEKYNIEAIEVSDIYEALPYLTGHQYETPKSTGQVTTEEYEISMKPLSKNSLESAENMLNEANESFDNTEIPNNPPSNTRDQIKDFLDNSISSLISSKDNFNSKLYYSSLSESFISRINSRFVKNTCDYYNSENIDLFFENLLKEANNTISNQSEKATSADIQGVVTLQCIGGAQKRAFEAENLLNEAKSDYNNSDHLGSQFNIAYAMERAESVNTWLELSVKFNDSISLDSEKILELALNYLETAEQSLLYSSLILDESGASEDSNDLLKDAESIISDAKSQLLNNYPAASLFSSLEALVKANLALEILGGITDEHVNKTKEQTLIAIEESRNLGVEPVLAVSYLEYAQSFDFIHKKDSLIFYKHARTIAKLSQVILEPTGSKKESRYVGYPSEGSGVNKDNTRVEKDLLNDDLVLLTFCFSLIFFIIGLLFGVFLNQKKMQKYIKKNDISNSTNGIINNDK